MIQPESIEQLRALGLTKQQAFALVKTLWPSYTLADDLGAMVDSGASYAQICAAVQAARKQEHMLLRIVYEVAGAEGIEELTGRYVLDMPNHAAQRLSEEFMREVADGIPE